MNEQSILFALKRIVTELDYDLVKSVDNPESEDEPTWEDLVEIFQEAYDENEEFEKEQEK